MSDAIVAGHLSLDIIPDLFVHAAGKFDSAFQPGRLVHVGPATISTGGAASNTGLALHRLGIDTHIIAKVGSDQFGQVVRQIIASHAPHLADGISTSTKTSTSYTVIVSPPGSDRRFLHHPGANDDFSADDVRNEDVRDARLFHFGYPPLMARMFEDGGKQLIEMFRRVKSLGLTTSLDVAFPDLDSAAGHADWYTILKNTLPYVDIFMPSLDEILFMLRRNSDAPLSMKLLAGVSDELLAMGTKMVALKLSDRGLYLRVAPVDLLQSFGHARPTDLTRWANYENWLPCFQVDVVGTTGSGDATIAGFLAALLRDMSPAEAMNVALGVGACNVEAADALGGIRSWDETLRRINAGWVRCSENIAILACFFAQIHFAGGVIVVVRDQAVIFTVHEWGRDHEISRGSITSNGDIPYNRHAQERLYVRVVGLGFKRIPEKDKEIDLVVNDLGTDLLVTAEWSAFEPDDLETELLFQNFPCCACSKNLMMC